jgi:hypothetical protein
VSFQIIWTLMNDISMHTTLCMISMNVPPTISLVQQSMLTFVYIDVLQTDLWLP